MAKVGPWTWEKKPLSLLLSYQGSAEAGAGYLGIGGLVGDSKLTWGDRAPHCIFSGGQRADLEGHSGPQLQLQPASPCSTNSASAHLEAMGSSTRAWHQDAHETYTQPLCRDLTKHGSTASVRVKAGLHSLLSLPSQPSLCNTLYCRLGGPPCCFLVVA